MDDLSQVRVRVTAAIMVYLRESISATWAALLYRPRASGVLYTCFLLLPPIALLLRLPLSVPS